MEAYTMKLSVTCCSSSGRHWIIDKLNNHFIAALPTQGFFPNCAGDWNWLGEIVQIVSDFFLKWSCRLRLFMMNELRVVPSEPKVTFNLDEMEKLYCSNYNFAILVLTNFERNVG
jgi:hypothetical protein